MDLLLKILILLGGIILGYLIGSLSFALIIGMRFYHKDVRQYGSKNAGGTNATRVLGRKAGFLVIFLDVFKAIFVYWTLTLLLRFTSLGAYAWISPTIYLSIIATALGHAYPVFYGFKGGKIVSIFAGFALATNWVITIISILIFFGLLLWKKMVSFASVSTATIFILCGWALLIPEVFTFSMYPTGIENSSIWYFATFFFISVHLIIRHRENIKRILAGTERKIGLTKKVS